MGNSPSRPNPPSGADGGVESAGSGSRKKEREHAATQTVPPRREPRRRDSIQAISSAKATAAPPSESLASAPAQNASQPRHQTPQARPRSRTVDTPPAQPRSEVQAMGQEQSRAQEERLANEKPYIYRGSQPVAVPGQNDGAPGEDVNPSGPPQESHYVPAAQAQRPPRLPLRIEEEVHTPGSPIISPADVSSALDHDDVEGSLPRKSSLLSSTTLGDEDDEDGFQHISELEPSVSKKIPTLIEWRQGGKQVYVTGTFAAWDRKFRLHRTPDPRVLSTTVQLSPGTHHIKFIVDGDMKLADDLPTAVDYTNILVNYIEVSADDVPDEPTKPVNIIQPHPPPGVFPPQVLPPTPEPNTRASRAAAASAAAAAKQKKPAGELIPPRDYGSVIPQYLQDGDQSDDGGSSSSHRSGGEQTNVPSPPSLPLFLGKSILNGTSLMKDDASVLSVPNHTILNHLATSSIKNGVLATSATTRYKRKYVSTILYKPTTNEDG